jgi:predicted amidophosphoribosyltransferase
VYPARRRWLTTHFIAPEADTKRPNDVVPIPLSLWNQFDDTFEHADQAMLDELATWVGLTPQEFSQALKLRIDCLEELSEGTGADSHEMFDAIHELRERSQKP